MATVGTAFVLPANFPLVGAGVSAILLLNVYQFINVLKHRRAAGVKYPTVYASEADAAKDPKKMQFNCAQRAHQNTLESVPFILAATGYLGLFHPKAATAGALSWVFGRIFYTINYSSGKAEKRNAGPALLGTLSLLGLVGGVVYTSVVECRKLIAAGL